AVGWIAHAGASGLVWSADLVRYVPALSYRVAPPSPLIVVAYYTASALTWLLWRHRADWNGSGWRSWAASLQRSVATMAALCAIWILVDLRPLIAGRGDRRLHATFIDVGQGDSSVIRFPHG